MKYEATGPERFVTLTCWAIGVVASVFMWTHAWGWFIVPIGVPQIAPLHVYGLVYMAALLSSRMPKEPATRDEYAFQWGWMIGKPLVGWLILWGLHFGVTP